MRHGFWGRAWDRLVHGVTYSATEPIPPPYLDAHIVSDDSDGIREFVYREATMSDHPNPPCPRCGSVFVPHRCGGDDE